MPRQAAVLVTPEPSRRSRFALRLSVSALAIGLAAMRVPAAAAQRTAAAQAAVLTLSPGDAIKLVVWKAPELNGEFVVAPDGSLAHPAFPALFVAGVPLVRVQAILDSAARAENVAARVVMQPMLRVVVGGEVVTPNLYHYPAGTSIAEALVMAGGHTARADMSRLVVIRNGHTDRYDLTDPSTPAASVAVSSGDQLLLGRSTDAFHERVLPFATLLAAVASIATLVVRVR